DAFVEVGAPRVTRLGTTQGDDADRVAPFERDGHAFLLRVRGRPECRRGLSACQPRPAPVTQLSEMASAGSVAIRCGVGAKRRLETKRGAGRLGNGLDLVP